ncbi:DsbA family oxidoreductase [Streptomyces sp. SPB074]|uniref:DsbA family oxidoreductase n=1 Tax=Streptomyces sp. (strain SPB074) TaxID=465543 RepID=UPI0001D1DDA4|nr:DsbA family oxidoreductase [Streptomyces sp. SPB074]EFG64303.1 FrnE protein [Streptomyces sp. SPB074]
MKEITVDIWTDVVCPWCYIGKRRFERALAAFVARDRVRVRWRSFELDPHALRVTDETIAERMLRRQGIPPHEAARLLAGVTDQAGAEGLAYRLDLARPCDTFDAHRLIHHAAAAGLAEPFQERLMRAYTAEGASVGDHPTLLALAREAGLDAGPAAEVLAGDAYAQDVRSDEDLAARLGVGGVPAFVVDGQPPLAGAQPATVLASLLGRAR